MRIALTYSKNNIQLCNSKSVKLKLPYREVWSFVQCCMCTTFSAVSNQQPGCEREWETMGSLYLFQGDWFTSMAVSVVSVVVEVI